LKNQNLFLELVQVLDLRRRIANFIFRRGKI